MAPPSGTHTSLARYSKATLFFVFHLHLFGSLVMLQNVVDALFFTTMGVEQLPTVRFLMAATMLPLTLVYDRVSARDRDSAAFAPMLVLGGLGVLALGLVRAFVDPVLGSYALMVASPVIQAFLLAEFWNFANRYFTIRESKRAFPQLFAAASLGGVAAGLATSTLASVTATGNLVFVWCGLELLGLAFIRAIRVHADPVQAADPMAEAEAADLARRRRHQLRPHRRSLRRRLRETLLAQPLVTGIVGLNFLGTVALFLAEYAWYDVFSATYTDAEALTGFLGLWSAVSSAINFGLSLFVLPRLATLLGVRNLTLVQPLLALVVFVALVASPVLAVAVVSYLAIQSRNVVEETNEKFLYKGLAPELAQVVRGRSEGMVKPLAAAFAALALFLFGTPDSPLATTLGLETGPLAVSLCGLVLGLGYVAIALLARVAYPRAIVERIRTRSFDPDGEAGEVVLDEGGESQAVLRAQLASNDAEIVRFAADYLHTADPELAVRLVLARLAEVAEVAGHDEADPLDASLRAELLECLAEWAPSLRHEILLPAVEPWLDHADGDLRAAALRVWAALPEAPIDPVLDALEDPSTEVRREAIAALCTHWDLMHVARGAERLVDLLRSDDEAARLGAVVVLGRLGDRRHLRMLTPLLADESAAVRLRAARILDERVDRSCEFLVDELVARLEQQREPAVRLHLLDALLRIGSAGASQVVLESGQGMPERVRRRSARFLAGFADTNAGLLERTLASPARPHGERVLAAQALTLGGVRFRALLGDVARAELTEAYLTLRDAHALERMGHASDTEAQARHRDALELLELALEDRRREALEIVIEIVGFASQHPDFDTIRTYCFSADPVARAYAIEALENLADRPLFELLLPFLTHDPNDELALAFGAIGTHLGLDDQEDDVLARRVDDAHPWLRACALFAAARTGHAAAQRAAADYAADPDPLVRETARWARTRPAGAAVTV